MEYEPVKVWVASTEPIYSDKQIVKIGVQPGIDFESLIADLTSKGTFSERWPATVIISIEAPDGQAYVDLIYAAVDRFRKQLKTADEQEKRA